MFIKELVFYYLTMENNNYETFYSLVRGSGHGSFELTIDKRLAKIMGLEIGDTVKVMIKKHKMNEDKYIEI